MAVWLWIALSVIVLMSLPVLKYKGRKLNLPPGPGGIPVLGSLPIFTASKLGHPMHVLADLAKRYGPIMFLRLGMTPCLVLSSPEVCRELFKGQDHIFASRPKTSAREHLAYGGRDIVLAEYGEHWRFGRKIVTLELLTHKKINQFSIFRQEVASAMVKAIYHDAVHSATTNLHTMLSALTFNFMTQICFSKCFLRLSSAAAAGATEGEDQLEIDQEEAKEFIDLITEAFTLLGEQVIGDVIPYLSVLDLFSNVTARMKKCHKRLDEFLTRILQEHRQHPKQKDPDFLDDLIVLQARNGSDHLDDTTIKALCMDMVLGGTDLSFNTLEWAMAEMVRHPDIAAKLQAELDSVVGKERLVADADLPNLPFLQAVVKETLRFHPAGPFNLPRSSIQQTKLMGYDIPANTTLFVNVWAITRDPAVWDNPMEFRPDRFLERPDIDVRGQHFELLSFGTGRRGCPGMGLGLRMVQYGLARLLQAFDWAPSKGFKPEDVDMEGVWGLTLPRAHALKAVATPRLSHHVY